MTFRCKAAVGCYRSLRMTLRNSQAQEVVGLGNVQLASTVLKLRNFRTLSKGDNWAGDPDGHAIVSTLAWCHVPVSQPSRAAADSALACVGH
jgi:hypothetical protein